jgi:hypothetical protein
MANRYTKLMSKREKLNRESYNPAVWRKGKRITDKTELRNWKISEIQRINRFLGGRSPTRKTIRTITGIELTEARKKIGKPPSGKHQPKAISFVADKIEGDLKSNTYSAKGNSLLLYNLSENKAVRVKADSLTVDTSKGLKGVTIKKRNLLSSWKDLY